MRVFLSLFLPIILFYGNISLASAQDVFEVNKDWQIHWGEIDRSQTSTDSWQDFVFTGRPAQRPIDQTIAWFRVRLPNVSVINPILHIVSVEQNMEVFLDGERIYEFGDINAHGQGAFAGYRWHRIPLPHDFGGRELKFRVFSQHRLIGINGQIRILPSEKFMETIITHNINSFSVGIITVFFGILGLSLFGLKSREFGYLYFGLFALSIGAYIVFRSHLRPLFFPWTLLSTHLEFAFFYGSTIGLCGFLENSFRFSNRNPAKWLWRIMLVYSLCVVPLAAMNVIPLMKTLFPFQLMVLLQIVFLAISIGYQLWKKHPEAKSIGMGFAAVLVAAAGDILISIGAMLPSMKGGLVFLPWGILALVCSFAWVLAQRFLAVYKQTLKHKDHLEALALEGRAIGQVTTLRDLLGQVGDSVKRLVGYPIVSRIFFSNGVFFAQNLNPGFYEIGSDGAASLVQNWQMSDFDLSKDTILTVRDPRSTDPLAIASIVAGADESIDISEARALIEPLTNNMASAITTVRLETAFSMLDRRTTQIRTIFTNIHQGILMVDSSLRVLPEHSDFLTTLFPDKQLSGCDLFDLLFSQATISADLVSTAKAVLSATFDEDIFSFDVNSDSLPNEIEIVRDSGSTWLEVDWVPLADTRDVIQFVMVTLRDVTMLRQLRAEAARNNQNVEILQQIVGVPVDSYYRFMDTARDYLASCGEIISGRYMSVNEVRELKRHLHTIKGNARTLKFHFITEVVHDVESLLIEMTGDGNNVPTGTQNILAKHIEKIKNQLAIYEDISDKKLRRNKESDEMRINSIRILIDLVRDSLELREKQGENIRILRRAFETLVRSVYNTFETLVRTQRDSLSRTAELLNIPIPHLRMKISDDWVIVGRYADVIHGVFGHLIANSLDHGFSHFEPNHMGTIFVETEINEVGGLIKYRDNGGGLNIDALRKKGQEVGILPDDATEVEIASVVFESGLSTATRVTSVSGRGVGLDAARKLLIRSGGSLHIRLQDTNENSSLRPFEVLIQIPHDAILFTIPPEEGMVTSVTAGNDAEKTSAA